MEKKVSNSSVEGKDEGSPPFAAVEEEEEAEGLVVLLSNPRMSNDTGADGDRLSSDIGVYVVYRALNNGKTKKLKERGRRSGYKVSTLVKSLWISAVFIFFRNEEFLEIVKAIRTEEEEVKRSA